MKTARFVLKCVALGLMIGAGVCAIIAYWDKISDSFYNLADKIEEKRAACHCCEEDDFDDWEASM